jgi:UDP-N-acetylmuramate dehydrogenase
MMWLKFPTKIFSGLVQETADVLQSVEIVTSSGDWCTLSKEREELAYSYRTSPFQKMKHVAAIVAATFHLTPCPNARQRQKLFLDRRRRTQPVTERSAGCVFRNPGTGCESAGALIDAAGLKGMSIGAARVSEKHANFLVNDGAARSQDMQALIALVKKQVYEKLGVQLQEEVQYVPCSSWVDTASVLF